MEDPRLTSINEKLNKYVALIRAENPKMLERDILQQAATFAMAEQKKFEASANLDVNDISITDRFGDGTKISTSKDGSLIVRVDHAWQQGKGSKISSDGFHKKDHSTITMPKEIDITTPEGDKKAGKFVDKLKTAKKRGDKMQADASQQAWENRKIQVSIDKKE